jgi:hypothetical protein
MTRNAAAPSLPDPKAHIDFCRGGTEPSRTGKMQADHRRITSAP